MASLVGAKTVMLSGDVPSNVATRSASTIAWANAERSGSAWISCHADCVGIVVVVVGGSVVAGAVGGAVVGGSVGGGVVGGCVVGGSVVGGAGVVGGSGVGGGGCGGGGGGGGCR